MRAINAQSANRDLTPGAEIPMSLVRLDERGAVYLDGNGVEFVLPPAVWQINGKPLDISVTWNPRGDR